MKFDYVIGNPPYQQESEKKSDINGQTRRKNVFHHFQIEADKIAQEGSVLIYPGGRWIHRSGKGMEQFGIDNINDKKLSCIEFYPDSNDVFGAAVDIGDGVSIVVKNQKKAENGFKYVYVKNGKVNVSDAANPGEELLPLDPRDVSVLKKVSSFVSNKKLAYIHNRILSQKLFGIESDFAEKNPDKVRLLTENSKIDYSKEIKLFTNDKAGKAGRSTWFITNRNVIEQSKELIDEWQVVVSSANAGGQKRDNQIEIIDNHSAFGRSRVALGTFKTFEEAKNFYNYCKTYVVRYTFLMTDEALTSLGKQVPDILDYSNNSVLDFGRDLDKQLYKLINLTEDEISYIVDKVNGIRKGDGING